MQYRIYCPNCGKVLPINTDSTVMCECKCTIKLTETADGYITLKEDIIGLEG